MTAPAIATDIGIALDRDADDELADLRSAFDLPRQDGGAALHYLCGHSLGLMPATARQAVIRELDRWSRLGAEAHFDAGGWFAFHERFSAPLAALIGAEAREVVAMNSLTVNLHLMLASFFRPTGERRRILIEHGAFPSDRYAVESQLAFHGLDPATELVRLAAESGRLTAESLDAALARDDGRVALVLLPGIQYLTGEAIDLAACAAVARRHGCRIGFDLAHAIGNLELDLRASEPDFAVWCSYKYLNGGPGAVGGCFVNRRWIEDDSLPRLAGWWGHDPRTRFDGATGFSPIASAEAWQLSNPPILAMAPLEASLTLFANAGLERLRRKSVALTGYLEALVRALCGDAVEILTPADPAGRGAQLSLRLRREATAAARIAASMRAAGVVVDWRAPDVLRLAPVPLYNRFVDVHAGASALAAALEE
ncbi:MAG TPA: kynureninase [Gammaproteobacteria bacterium]|nr:kynureninase [Gammaproteobacteria bacterium]